MNDRLADLYKIDNFNEQDLVEVPIDVDQIEMPAGMKEFGDEVDAIRTGISQIKSNIETLVTGYRSVLLSVTETTTQEDMNRTLEQSIEVSIKDIADKLKRMSVSNETALVQTRWRTNVHANLTRKFMDLMTQYRGLQADHKNRVQERITQRLRIVKPDATQEEIQNVVEGGKLNVFANEIHKENQAQALAALTYVEGRHRELVKIENSVNELHQLFCDMAILVNQQGEHIDNIENNVSAAKAYTEAATRDLVQARKRATSRRWCKFWSCLIFMIIIAILITVLVVMGKQKGWL